MEHGRIENHHVVQRLHNNATIIHESSGTIDKGLVGHIILMNIRLNPIHGTVVYKQMRDAETGANPNVMTGILHHSMNHFVPQSVLTFEYALFTVLLQLQSSVKSRPFPTTTVRKLTVYVVTVWFRRKIQFFSHSPEETKRFRIIPCITFERRRIWLCVQQTSRLCAKPHTTLSVKSYRIHICPQFPTFAQRQFFYIYFLACG